MTAPEMNAAQQGNCDCRERPPRRSVRRHRRRTAQTFLALAVVASAAASLRAHEGPEHVIDELTAAMERTGPSAELLFCRALEYRALRNYERAEADLRRAIEFHDRIELVARTELARVLVKRGQDDEAAKLVDAMLARHGDPQPDYYCELVALKGEIAFDRRQWQVAAEQFTAALETRPEVSWFILRSRAQSHLPKQTEQQIAGLRAGIAATQSPVLLRELCDTQIAAAEARLSPRPLGRGAGGEGAAAAVEPVLVSNSSEIAEAKKIIASELAASRFQSAWLIRRARVRRLTGDDAAARSDLQAALAELEPRIHPERPDVALVIDRGVCFALLDDVAAARRDLQRATWAHAPEWMLTSLTTALAGRTAPTAVGDDD